MPVVINKVGAHKNEDALENVVYYMINSQFFKVGNCRGVLEYSAPGIVDGFRFTKEMFDKTDGKQVAHIVIGTKNEGLIEEDLIDIAEAAQSYFYDNGYQSCYALHRGSCEDPDYLHIHMAVNTVNFQDGKRLYESYSVTNGPKKFLQEQFNAYEWSSINDNSSCWET